MIEMRRKSIREVLDNPQADEYYVLVTRYYPMEMRRRRMKLIDSPLDVWDRELAPSPELLKDYKEGLIDWNGYVWRFMRENKIKDLLSSLYHHMGMAKMRGREAVLVCIEEESEYPKCHTWILLEGVLKYKKPVLEFYPIEREQKSFYSVGVGMGG